MSVELAGVVIVDDEPLHFNMPSEILKDNDAIKAAVNVTQSTVCSFEATTGPDPARYPDTDR
ncbi:hypothetical protein [Candidatus Reidiella endopervernicosa]|uniref:Uncharacterized protein n=1 Tax=Candidatus Reidiella endopervernicosa TaxID=2738883 RepID=A0A6N0HYJ6_9GAMM|nr:hypothetical protein [Candidatus Reidiella endopervernicosa]QKQ27347.1 hypothetical protein HUE57_14425 [Candidatus Reidiella endopervernicosa]